MFGKYHYLSHSMNTAAHVYVATVNGDIAAFTSVLAQPHPVAKNLRRFHRTVVLPDFQGLGLAMRLTDFIAEMWHNMGYRITTTMSHPKMLTAHAQSAKWRAIRRAGHITKSAKSFRGIYRDVKQSSARRITCTFEYIGEGSKHGH